MRKWILENTKITAQEYDDLINPVTVDIKGISDDITKQPLTDHPIIDIDMFTLAPPTEERLQEFNIQKEDDYYIYRNIRFIILAEILTSLKSVLYSEKRFGRCFKLGVKIGLMTPKSKIVTAICKDIFHKPQEPFLHTFAIIKDPSNNEEYVLDGTMNTIMKKQEYLELFEAKIISEISKKEFIKVAHLLSKLKIDDEITLLEYLCFPKETKKTAKRLIRLRKYQH